jgi:hypothetical protein
MIQFYENISTSAWARVEQAKNDGYAVELSFVQKWCEKTGVALWNKETFVKKISNKRPIPDNGVICYDEDGEISGHAFCIPPVHSNLLQSDSTFHFKLGESFFSIPSTEGLNRAWIKKEIEISQRVKVDSAPNNRSLSRKFCSKVLKDLNMIPLLLKDLEKSVQPISFTNSQADNEWAQWISVTNMCVKDVYMRRPSRADSWWSLLMLVSHTPKYRDQLWTSEEVMGKRRIPMLLGGKSVYEMKLEATLRPYELSSQNMPQALMTAMNQAPRTAVPNYEKDNNQGHIVCRSKRFQKDLRIKAEKDSDYIITWSCFKPTLKGVLDVDSEHFLDFYGLPKPEHGSSTSEAHSLLRYIVSINQCELLNRLINSVHQHRIYSDEDFVLCDIGAKFKSMYSLLVSYANMCILDVNDAYSLCRQKNWNALDQCMINAGWTIRARNIMRDGRWVDLGEGIYVCKSCGVHLDDQSSCPICSRRLVIQWTEGDDVTLRERTMIRYIAIRPNESIYDQVYWAENKMNTLYAHTNYARDNLHVQLSKPVLNKCYLRKDDAFQDVHAVYVNDAHYYLSGFNFSKIFENAMMYIAGADFHPIPGTYRLPKGCGWYTVNQGMVTMNTNGSGDVYQHPLVYCSAYNKRYTFGWYTPFWTVVPSSRFEILQAWTPPNFGPMADRFCLQDYWLSCRWSRNEIGSGVSQYYSANANPLSSFGEWLQREIKVLDTTTLELYGVKIEVDTFVSWLSWQGCSFKSRIVIAKANNRWWNGCGLINDDSVSYNVEGYKTQMLKEDICEYTSKKNETNESYIYNVKEGMVRQRLLNGKQAPIFTLAQDTGLPKINVNFFEEDVVIGQAEYTDDYKITWMKDTKIKAPQHHTRKEINARINDTLVSKDYLYVKPLDAELNVPSSITESHRERWAEDAQKALNIAQKMESRGKFPNLKNQLMKDASAKLLYTGLKSTNKGVNMKDFEWNSKSQHNALYALLFRHCLPNITFDSDVLKDFSAFSKSKIDSWWDNIEKGFIDDWSKTSWDPMSWVTKKSDWGKGKQVKYLETMRKHMKKLSFGKICMINPFTSMVKEGEVNYSDTLETKGLLLANQSSRPRNIFVPPPSNCTFLVYMQSLMWNSLKNNIPGFIQGYSKKDYEDWIKNRIKDIYWAISIDGSAFDATQFAELMDCCENYLFSRIQKSSKLYNSWVSMVKRSQKERVPVSSMKNLWDSMWESARLNDTWVFTRLPSFCSKTTPWTEDQMKAWNASQIRSSIKKTAHRELSMPWLYWLATPLTGTTFSGHSTKTTLGNTLRSILYAEYYVYKSGVVRDPSNPIHIWASGDDVNIFMPKKIDGLMIKESIHNLTHSKKQVKEGRCRGLGQCVPDVLLTRWDKIDFCSKMFLCRDHKIEDLHMYRDVKKVIFSRTSYTGKNTEILCHPWIHSTAIYEGFKTEKVSVLLEKILERRNDLIYNKYSDQSWNDRTFSSDVLEIASDRYKWALTDHTQGYAHEFMINNHLGIGWTNYYSLLRSDEINCHTH